MGLKPTFLSELKRRQIYRGGVMYVVAGWVMVQVATGVFPYFNIPPWAIRFVVVAILVGFPVSLVCLWMFESVNPDDPEKHLHERRQGGRDDSPDLAKLMQAERAERQKETQELISALAQLKAGSTVTPVDAPETARAVNTVGISASAAVPAPVSKRKGKISTLAAVLFIVLMLAGAWILFGPETKLQPTIITGELTEKYVAPGFSQVEKIGAELLRPVLRKLGINIAPERVFTVLLVLIAFLILRDFYRQLVNSRARRLRSQP